MLTCPDIYLSCSLSSRFSKALSFSILRLGFLKTEKNGKNESIINLFLKRKKNSRDVNVKKVI